MTESLRLRLGFYRGAATKLAIPALLMVAALVGACATTPEQRADPTDSNLDQSLPMIAFAGYRDDSEFYVKYRVGEQTLYGGGNWRERIQLIEDSAPRREDYAVPTLVPIQYRRTQPWEPLPADRVEIPIFPVEQWQRLRERLLRSEVPADGHGIVVDFVHAEYFLYYDRAGVFQATRMRDKPPDYRVKSVLRFDEFMQRGRPILEQFLRENDVSATEFVFNTGDAGLYSLPFLYINTEHRLLVFVRNVPLTPVAVTEVPGIRGGQAFGHFLRSHLTNLVLRPVSSLYRLFFTVTDTTVATLRFDWTAGLIDKPVPEVAAAPPMDLRLWEQDLAAIARRSATSGEIEILVDGERFFPRFIDRISNAQESVQLQTYIFDNDDYAVGIGELLKRRSNEGVDVRVLLDGMGTIAGTLTDSDSQPQHHEPPASVRLFLESDSKVQVRQKANPWFTGDHVKSTIIDRQVAYVGGMNIGREYRYDWHDLMMELRGPVVDKIAREFDLAWTHAGPLGDLGYVVSQARPYQRRNSEPGKPMRVLLTGPGNYQIYNAQLEAARRAQSYIYLQNAYFTDDRLLRELVMARRRGVDVRVIIPIETDHGLITRSNILATNLMLDNGIRVFLYPGFSHVKAAIFDGWVCLGSANFDRLSLRINRELNIASSDPGVARQLLEQLFEQDFRASPELTERIPERWIDHLVEIVGDFVY